MSSGLSIVSLWPEFARKKSRRYAYARAPSGVTLKAGAKLARPRNLRHGITTDCVA